MQVDGLQSARGYDIITHIRGDTMPMTDKKRRTDAAWKKANRASLTCTLYKSDATAFREYATEHGKSVNELFREYVAQCLGRPLERRSVGADQDAETE